MQRILPALVPLVLALPAGAQSINIDFEPANTPVGMPTPNYGASGNAGVWNSVSSFAVTGLRGWDGEVTGVSLTLGDNSTGCGSFNDAFAYANAPTTSGQAEALLDDRYNPGASIMLPVVFQGLQPGAYVVDVIIPPEMCVPSSGVRVEVVGSPDPPATANGTWAGAYVQGQNFTRHHVTVTDGTLTMVLEAVFFVDYIEVAGIQLHFDDQELPGTPMCFGDGSGGACPCANTGREGRGCENSAGTDGAVLFAMGTTSPDTVVLRSSSELPNALSIFLQGNASITPVVYGDGLRCTGGTLKRLYTKSASAGVAFAPGPGDPSITVRSAQLGVPIPSPGRRYYQVFYRDPSLGFCPDPPGNTFNVSSAVRILW